MLSSPLPPPEANEPANDNYGLFEGSNANDNPMDISNQGRAETLDNAASLFDAAHEYGEDRRKLLETFAPSPDPNSMLFTDYFLVPACTLANPGLAPPPKNPPPSVIPFGTMKPYEPVQVF